MNSRIKAVIASLILLAGFTVSCRQEEPAAPIFMTKIQFAESKKTLMTGQRATVALMIEPPIARMSVPVAYSVSEGGIVVIDMEHSSNEGVVFEAVSPGSTVIIARAGMLIDYCSVTVEGDNEIVIPYIAVTDSVLEVAVGRKKHVVASLQGGMPGDQNNFVFINNDDSVVYMEYANNTAVIEGVKPGSVRITAVHPKAQYSVDVLVFVLNEGETAKYITGENVVFMEMSGGTQEYAVRMAGLPEEEVNYCIYEVVEGRDIVTVKGSGASCALEAKKTGVAKVRVTNQAAAYPFEFQVVVRSGAEAKYVSASTNFCIIDGADMRSINVTMIGGVPDDFINYYTYALSAEGIVGVQQFQDNFVINGLKNGTVILTINNKYSDFPCEILLVVQNQEVSAQSQEVYIRTSQSVIQMEVGGPDALLKMELAGGNEADKNNFEWVVEDSAIITAAAPGQVRYMRSMAGFIQNTVEAEAIITAKKTGTTRIRVSNIKARALNEVVVLVKVYPKGTFSGKAIYLSGPGIVRVQEGQSVDVYTPIVGGNSLLLGTTKWESKDLSIAEVNGSGVYGSVKGIKSGVTRLCVTGGGIAQPFEAVVVIYREGEEGLIPYIYTDKIYYQIAVGQTIQINVHHPNISGEDFSFSVINTNKESVLHTVNRDVILVNGYSEGSGELVITAADVNCNNLTLYITVMPQEVDPSRPYMLTGPHFAGTDEGGVITYTVDMAGANAGKLNGIVYSIDDERVARVKGRTANQVEIEGLSRGQTVLRINHSESMNEKAVVVYVVARGENVAGKIVIGIEQTNYVMQINQSLFVRLLTNATEAQKLGIRWSANPDSKVYIEENYDTAVITAREEGSVKVTVYEIHNNHVIDLDLFITIRGAGPLTGEIGFPDSVILVKNQHKTVKGNAVGFPSGNIADIGYSFADQGIATLMGSGLEVTLKGESAGQTFLTVTSSLMSYYKKILVICVDHESDLDNLYYFTVDKMLYRIKTGDEIKVNLIFGENGFPENEGPLIEWHNTSGNDAVIIAAQGKRASVIGKNEGQAVIQIRHRFMPKPVEVVVEVSGSAQGSDSYRFVYAPIHQMSRGGEPAMLPISIYYGMIFFSETDRYNPGIKMEQGYSGIEVRLSDSSVAEAAMAGQFLRVNALKAGRTEVTLHHELIAEDARMLLVVYDGDVPSAAEDFILFVPKTHYLIPKGQTQTVRIIANADTQTALGGIRWNNHNQDLFSVDSGNKTAARVEALAEGSGIITIERSGAVVGTVYVSVSDGAAASGVSVATESIIVMSLADGLYGGYTTRIVVNGGNEYNISWSIADESVAGITGLGTSCVVCPVGYGLTELTVTGNGFKKTIVVKVVGTEAEKLSTYLINIDQRFFKIKKDETVVLNPYYKVNKPSSGFPAQARPVFDNRVIQAEPNGINGGIAVTGKNVGIEYLRLWNQICENEIDITFEVDEAVSGSVSEAQNVVFMTTPSSALILEPGTKNYYMAVDVIGEYGGSESDFIWSSNSGKVTVNGMGSYALISAGNQTGEADITVSNRYCTGVLTIKVIVGNKYVFEGGDEPYIYTAKTVYTMNKGDTGLVIPLEIRNVNTVDYGKVTIYSSGSAARVSFANGSLAVSGEEKGTGTIRIKYSGIEQALTIYIVVQESSGGGTAYLTTGQNYVIVNKNDTKVVDVSLVNYTEPDSGKYSWSSGNTSVAHVIGNGRTVQILGIDVGITKVTVKHPESYNDLDIVVKVIPAGLQEIICYLTTGENVIETYISTNSSQITVNKVGGVTQAMEAIWSVDDPTVVGIMGNNNVCYYTAKKAGVAKITVSDREAGSLSIVVIVRRTRPGDQFLMSHENVKQITPGSTNNVLSVYLTDGEDVDEKDFRWELYSQLPSNIDVARQGGNVISIYAMGSRASVNGIYAGTARIKVTHPKAAQALFLLVQVTRFASMRFTQRDVVLTSEDMTYVSLETPDYENYTGKVKYSTNNPAVCTVIGSSKAALLSSHMAGKAVITAYVEGTDLLTTVNVTVVPERNFDEPDIVTSKTTYLLSPRERPFVIDAVILGVGVSEQDYDSLIWKVIGLDDEKPMLKIYPENYVYTDNGITRKGSKGRHLQIEVQNRKYEQPDSCTIEISCPSVTSKVRTVFLQVQEDSNAFTLSKRNVALQSGEMVELTCNIIGGGSKDYDEVCWVAQKDSFDPTKEIAKIMGKGRSVQLLGMADGITVVTAVYRGLMDACVVTVKSAYYLNIQYQNFLTSPGAREADGGPLEIGYEVRPAAAFIQWMDTDTNSDKRITQSISYEAAVDKNKDGTGTGRILIVLNESTPVEGTFTIMGTSNNKVSRVNVIVKNSYRFTLNSYNINIVPNERREIGYTISPGNAIVKIRGDNSAINNLKDKGFEIDVSPARASASGEKGKGEGTIYIKNMQETLNEEEIVFELFMPNGQSTGITQTVRFNSRYPMGQARVVPVFERIYGAYSNKGKPDYNENQTIYGWPIGQMYKGKGQYLSFEPSLSGSDNGKYNDVYSLVIGDGEEHYILLDKVNSNAYIEYTNLTNNGIYSSKGSQDDLGEKPHTLSSNPVKTRGIQVEAVAGNAESGKPGEKAVRISGGKDYIVYSNFGSDYDLYCTLYSDKTGILQNVTRYAVLKTGVSYDYSDTLFLVYHKVDNSIGYGTLATLNSLNDFNYVSPPNAWDKFTGKINNNKIFDNWINGGYVAVLSSKNNIAIVSKDSFNYEIIEEIKGESTQWYPFQASDSNPYGKFVNGNIKLLFERRYEYIYNNPAGVFWDGFVIKPYINYNNANLLFNGGDFYSSVLATGWFTAYGLEGITYYKTGVKNFIHGRQLQWHLEADPLKESPEKNDEMSPIKYLNGDALWLEPNQTGNYINIEKGKYTKRNTPSSTPIKILYDIPFGGNYEIFRILGGPVYYKYSMIDIFKERYNKNDDAKLLSHYDSANAAIYASNDISTYPCRYFPMPSTNTSIINELGRIDRGKIEIKYNNAYGSNMITIHLTQEIRQCHANYVSPNSPTNTPIFYKQAQNWGETIMVKRNNIFGRTITEPDGSADSEDMIRIDSSYYENQSIP